MQRLHDDPVAARAMGAASRERYESLFTARRMAQGYETVYRELLSARR